MKNIRHHTLAATLMAAGLLGGGLAPALAQDGARAVPPKFRSLDLNQDGYLSRAELRRQAGYAEVFDQADENRDGRLDADEFVKAESIRQRQQAAKYVDDSLITAKVKAALFREQALKALDVGVETHGGQVLLSGFVENETQLRTALQTAAAVEGVVAVRNGMTLK